MIVIIRTNNYSIKDFKVFSLITPEELELMKDYLFYREYKKNQLLFSEGDPRERIYFLIDGFVKLEKINLDASASYTSYIKPKELFPYRGMFFDDYYDISASAISDIKVYYIPTTIFEQFVKENNERLSYIILELSHIISKQVNRIQISSVNHVREKVEFCIAYLMKNYGEDIGDSVKVELPMTIKELSIMLGVSRESVSACCSELKKENLISLKNKNIIILNRYYFNCKLM